MIRVDNLTINKRTFKLGPINMEIEEGYVYAITGNSGSGKTLFLQTLLGGIFSEKNAITYDNLNFEDNEVDIRLPFLLNLIELDKRFNIEKCFEFLSKNKVYRHKKIYELSQGERKILLFSIGYFTNSKILVLDNPFSGVGLIARKEMLRLLRNYMDDDKTVIIVTEDPYIIQSLADYIIVFENGGVTLKEDVVELQARFNTTDIENILLSILKGEGEND